MNKKELNKWFRNNVNELEGHYINKSDARGQSGFSCNLYKWTKCRKVIADCIKSSGAFLDVGCANGYLLECILRWKAKDGLIVIPYGLDIGSQLIEFAKKRFPNFSGNFYHGNILDWEPMKKFDYVRTELVYVPKEYRKILIDKLLNKFVKPKGSLLLTEYRSSKDNTGKEWINVYAEKQEFKVSEIRSAYYKNKELTRVAVIKNK